jgi:hypothetical protein
MIGLQKPQLKVENFPDLPLPPVDFNDLASLLENLGVERERFSFSTTSAVSAAVQPARGARQIPGADEDPGDWWIEENQEEARLWLPVMGMQLRLLLPFVKAEALLSGASTLSPVQWRNILRVLYFYGFLEYTGLLLHASGLVRGNRAYVFPGVSDAGKTTIVRHSPGMPVLSDEVVAVRLGGRNEVPVAFGTPFYGDWGRPGEMIHQPIQGLYFPVKSTETRLEPLTPRETLTRLLPCIFSYTVFPARLEKLVDFGIQLASQVPAFAFYFQPGAKMWETIDAP